MNAIHAFAIAVLQGVTELFPISSLGHAVIVPSLLRWPIDQHSPEFLPFLVVLHVGTAVALLIYFWREWLSIGLGILQRGPASRDAWHALGLIAVATLPAVVIGLLFEKLVRGLFASPVAAALFLVANGFLLLLGDWLRVRAAVRAGRAPQAAPLGWRGALAIGLWQCLAFLPGISRSGAAIVGGLVSGLQHAEAAHFSFLIATPIIAGAAVLEIPKLLALPGHGISGLAIASGVVAGVTAYLSIAFLMRYFRRHDFDDALVPFAIYCWIAGAGAALMFAL
ncbi:MAG TPA: undecaprenyl-diphosphate phosphatase [Stellaceae bacterium]|nr:undecaprenyl-diphosphate phosphatase [Stellaceae bacterium]